LSTETIRPDDTAGTLLERLAEYGAGLLIATLDGIESGELEARAQPPEGLSLAPKLTVADAEIDWARPAFAIDRQIRGCTPSPGAWTTLGDARIKLGPVQARADVILEPGIAEISKHRVLVGTATHAVELGDVQPPGKPKMAADAWGRGLRESAVRLGSS
jgi:methionyl-tRNA formyltransferase